MLRRILLAVRAAAGPLRLALLSLAGLVAAALALGPAALRRGPAGRRRPVLPALPRPAHPAAAVRAGLEHARTEGAPAR